MRNLPAITPAKAVDLPAQVAAHARRIVEAGTTENARRASQGDLGYFWGWADVTAGIGAPTYPVLGALLVRFVTDHLGGLDAERDCDLVRRGIKARLRPQRWTTTRRRLATLSAVHEAKGLDNFRRAPRVRKLLRKAARAGVIHGRTVQKKRAATPDVLDLMLATCGDSLIDLRSGFVTESGRQGVPLGDAKALSGHPSDVVAMGSYQSGAVLQHPAARVFD